MGFLFVAIGGALGALARHGTGLVFKRYTDESQWGIMTVNLIGCFMIGLLWAAFDHKFSDSHRMLVFTGFLGAFTTFSTYNLDAWKHISSGKYVAAFTYLTISIVGGLALVLVGCKMGDLIKGRKAPTTAHVAPHELDGE